MKRTLRGRIPWLDSVSGLAEAISELFDQEMSEGYVSAETLLGYFRSNHVLVCYEMRDGGVVGAVIAKRVTDIADVTPPEHVDEVKAMTDGLLSHEFGYLSGVVVKRGYQGHRIGSRLCVDATNWMRLLDLDSALSFGWEDKDGCHIEGAAAQAGLHRSGTIEDFWLLSVLKRGSSCPTCGLTCHCSAVVLVGDLNA